MEEQQKKHRRGRRVKKKNIVSNIILVVAIGAFLFSAYKLYEIYAEYEVGEKEYEHIIEVVITEKVVEDEETGEERKDFIVDFDALKSMNSDTVGWIRFDEPFQISYPLMQGADNDKYLNTTVEGTRNAAGAIFVDAANAVDFSDRNTFIYGHNMKNGSMFGQLRKYKDASFCKQNPYFYIYTPDGKEMKYQIFAVKVVEDTGGEYQKGYGDDASFLEYIKLIRTGARYTSELEICAEDKIISLSTCTNVRDEERLLVHGVKIGERIIGE